MLSGLIIMFALYFSICFLGFVAYVTFLQYFSGTAVPRGYDEDAATSVLVITINSSVPPSQADRSLDNHNHR